MSARIRMCVVTCRKFFRLLFCSNKNQTSRLHFDAIPKTALLQQPTRAPYWQLAGASPRWSRADADNLQAPPPFFLPFLGCWKEVHETTHTQAKTPFATRLNPFPKRLCHDNIIAASSSVDSNDQKLFLLHIVTKSTANTPCQLRALWLHPRQA